MNVSKKLHPPTHFGRVMKFAQTAIVIIAIKIVQIMIIAIMVTNLLDANFTHRRSI